MRITTRAGRGSLTQNVILSLNLRFIGFNRLLTTLAYQLNGRRTYAYEGAIFIARAAVQWLRDGISVIKTAQGTGSLAKAADPAQNIYLVPAFVGLGAPC